MMTKWAQRSRLESHSVKKECEPFCRWITIYVHCALHTAALLQVKEWSVTIHTYIYTYTYMYIYIFILKH